MEDSNNIYEQIRSLVAAAELFTVTDKRKDILDKLYSASRLISNEIKKLESDGSDRDTRMYYRTPRPTHSNYYFTTSSPSIINRLNTLDRIYITQHLYLDAKKVKTFTQVQTMGELYYVESCKHFAIKIFDILLHGNIGKIYNKFDSSKKIKPCRFGKLCPKLATCGFYHDPTIMSGSTDIRNFIADNFMYTPPFNNNKPRLRKFGSVDNLDTDIILLNEENIDEFSDQTMHELLCVLLLKKYYRR
jgi:hypothetical protein